MILGGPKDTITSIWTKSLKALVPPKSLGPPPMGGVGVDFKDRAITDIYIILNVKNLSECLLIKGVCTWPTGA